MVSVAATAFGVALFIYDAYDGGMNGPAIFFSALFALILTAPASAAPSQSQSPVFMFETGKSLLARCENKAPEYALACTAYVVGVVDGIKKDIYLGRARDNCWPDLLSADQVRTIVVKYLKDFPDQRGFPASLVVSVALNDAFPCQK